MARLQDFPTVTPTSSDKLLVVQSQGQGLVPYGSKLDSANPTGTGKLTMTGNGVFSGDLTINGSTSVGTLLAGMIKGITLSGNQPIDNLQTWCKNNEKGLYWGCGYVTTPFEGWALVLLMNKIASNGHAEIYIFQNAKIVTSYTSNLTATTPTWSTKSGNLS